MSKNFAITGVAGYIAPRHLKAIKETGNTLVAAIDPHDSVGLLDSYFPDVSFFVEFERFSRHLEKLRRVNQGQEVHYVSVCSPNHLHDAHIRTALRSGANVICEKPLVLNPWNLDALAEVEEETGKRINTVLQLRVHETLCALKQKIDQESKAHKHKVTLTYITSRGKWYHYSWKGRLDQSGGLATNIGVHFFDLLQWLFGSVVRNEVHYSDQYTVSGYLELERAHIPWFLSIDAQNLPDTLKAKGQRTFRSISIDSQEVEFSEGFTDLHTKIYERTLAGNGFGIEDIRNATQIVHDIRNLQPMGVQKHSHQILKEK
ncbi:Gfo/Idh/MocA family oxidoreductase [Deltaproteobacteria bacterium TL4]